MVEIINHVGKTLIGSMQTVKLEIYVYWKCQKGKNVTE